MKKWLSMTMLALTVSVLTVGPVSASTSYDPSGDQTINLLSGSGVQVSGSTATTTFDLQEGVQQTVTDTTGLSVEHDYYWVDVNGTPVVAVDPPCPMF